MCCGCKCCMMLICVALVIIAIGLVFGFGVFKNGFHKLKDTFHEDCDPRFSSCGGGRPFLGYAAPPPF